MASIANRAKEKSIPVSSDVYPPESKMIGNEFSINEMITNLLSNVVKYILENRTSP